MLSILGGIDLSLSNWDHIVKIKGNFFVSLEKKPKMTLISKKNKKISNWQFNLKFKFQYKFI